MMIRVREFSGVGRETAPDTDDGSVINSRSMGVEAGESNSGLCGRGVPPRSGKEGGRTHLTTGHRPHLLRARFLLSCAFFRRARFDAPVSVGRNKSKLANSKRSRNSYYAVSRSARNHRRHRLFTKRKFTSPWQLIPFSSPRSRFRHSSVSLRIRILKS